MSDLSEAFSRATKSVTKEWAKQRKAESASRRTRASRVYMYSDRVNFTDVMDQILPGAYAHASGNGRYSVSKRQLYYACRAEFMEETDRELDYGYFANTLVVQYKNRYPSKTSSWKITADPRGTLSIPNAAYEIRVPVGTLPIENHLHHAGRAVGTFDDLQEMGVEIEWPSISAGERYQVVLYIEKEGFEPVLKEAKIAERFDAAVMSCKGQSVVAARRFIDEVCAVGNRVPLLVVHDFDKPGFEIAERLTTVSWWAEETDRVTYQFQNEIDVRDLGLHLEDIEKYELQDKAELCRFKGKFYSDSTATKEEQAFLASGRRVELNAMTSPQFVEWLESKLTEQLSGRLIPDADVLEKAYRRAVAVARINELIDHQMEKAIEEAENEEIPLDICQQLKEMVEASGKKWDAALYDIAKQNLP